MTRIVGKVAEIGYVVRDIDASMQHWVQHGVGPWSARGCVMGPLRGVLDTAASSLPEVRSDISQRV
jgi:hypothetical protein